MNFIKQYKTQFFVILPILLITFFGIIYLNNRNKSMLGGTYVNPQTNIPTNLTVSSFATSTISQWVNDAGYASAVSAVPFDIYLGITSTVDIPTNTLISVSETALKSTAADKQVLNTAASYYYIDTSNYFAVTFKMSDLAGETSAPCINFEKFSYLSCTNCMRFETTTNYILYVDGYELSGIDDTPTGTPKFYATTTASPASVNPKTATLNFYGDTRVDQEKYYALVFRGGNTFGNAWGMRPASAGSVTTKQYTSSDAGATWVATTTERTFAIAGSPKWDTYDGLAFPWNANCMSSLQINGMTSKNTLAGQSIPMYYGNGYISGFNGLVKNHYCSYKTNTSSIDCTNNGSSRYKFDSAWQSGFADVVNSTTIYLTR